MSKTSARTPRRAPCSSPAVLALCNLSEFLPSASNPTSVQLPFHPILDVRYQSLRLLASDRSGRPLKRFAMFEVRLRDRLSRNEPIHGLRLPFSTQTAQVSRLDIRPLVHRSFLFQSGNEPAAIDSPGPDRQSSAFLIRLLKFLLLGRVKFTCFLLDSCYTSTAVLGHSKICTLASEHYFVESSKNEEARRR
jgi:hypothetical protein